MGEYVWSIGMTTTHEMSQKGSPRRGHKILSAHASKRNGKAKTQYCLTHVALRLNKTSPQHTTSWKIGIWHPTPGNLLTVGAEKNRATKLDAKSVPYSKVLNNRAPPDTNVFENFTPSVMHFFDFGLLNLDFARPLRLFSHPRLISTLE